MTQYKRLTRSATHKPPANTTKIISEYGRKFHNHKLQTNPWHREEEPHSNHEALGKQTKQSNQISLPHLLALFLILSLSLSLSLSPPFSLLAHLSTLYSLSLSLSLSLSVCVYLSTLYSILFVVLHSLFSLSLTLLCLSLRLSLLCLPLYVCLYSVSLSFSLYTLPLYSLSLYTLFSTCTPLNSLYT